MRDAVFQFEFCVPGDLDGVRGGLGHIQHRSVDLLQTESDDVFEQDEGVEGGAFFTELRNGDESTDALGGNLQQRILRAVVGEGQLDRQVDRLVLERRKFLIVAE